MAAVSAAESSELSAATTPCAGARSPGAEPPVWTDCFNAARALLEVAVASSSAFPFCGCSAPTCAASACICPHRTSTICWEPSRSSSPPSATRASSANQRSEVRNHSVEATPAVSAATPTVHQKAQAVAPFHQSAELAGTATATKAKAAVAIPE